jgi:hypothetical protein
MSEDAQQTGLHVSIAELRADIRHLDSNVVAMVLSSNERLAANEAKAEAAHRRIDVSDVSQAAVTTELRHDIKNHGKRVQSIEDSIKWLVRLVGGTLIVSTVALLFQIGS